MRVCFRFGNTLLFFKEKLSTMKKFVTTTLFGFAVAACAFAFTACGETKETSYTVTADEWKTAITSVYDCSQNVQCVTELVKNGSEHEADGDVYKLWCDSSTKTIKIELGLENEKLTGYVWAENGKYYQYLEGGVKEEITQEDFTIMAASYSGNGILQALVEDEQSFANTTYDVDSKQYKGSSVQYGDEFEYSLKFENGKLVQLSAVIGNLQINTEYKYEKVSVSVPEEIKNLPLD